MIRLLCGEETYLIDKKLQQITGDWNSPVFFDETAKFDPIMDELENNSLFNNRKEIVISNPLFLKDKKMLNIFIGGIKNLMSNDDIVIIHQGKMTSKNKLWDYIKENGEVLEYNKLESQSLIKFIKMYIEKAGGQIERSTIIKIIDLVPNNLLIIKNELDKLIANNLMINSDDVEALISKYYEDDFFEIVNAISVDNKIKLVEAFENKRHLGVNNMIIISQIAKTFSLAYRVISLKKNGLNNTEISAALKLHTFRLKKINDLINNIPEWKIKEILKLLASIEAQIKMGKIDEETAINYLLVNLIK